MSKFPVCTYNYSVFRDGDIFMSHGCDLVGWLIRFGQRGIDNASDLSQPNHAGFIYTIEGQVFAAEVGEHGIELHSLDEYCKPDNQIVGVLRPDCFNDVTERQAWRVDMARWIRKFQDSGYPVNKAIRSAIKWWPFHGKKDADQEFCSDDVCAWLIKYGYSWLIPGQDPADLRDSLTRRHAQFPAVLGYKNFPSMGAV